MLPAHMRTTTRQQLLHTFLILMRDPSGVRYCNLAEIWLRQALVEWCGDGEAQEVDDYRAVQILRQMQGEAERHEGLVDGIAATAREKALTDALAQTQQQLKEAQARIAALELAATGIAG